MILCCDRMRMGRWGFWALAVVGPTVGAAVPTAISDGYPLVEGETLTVAAGAGVLANDDRQGQPVEVVLVDSPAEGELVLDTNGGFRYTPAPGATGEVSFMYKMRTVVGPVLFTIDPAQSRLQVEARATTEYGVATDRDDSRVGGTLRAQLRPASAPFALARVTALEARLLDPLVLRLRFGCLFSVCLASVNVQTRATEADGLKLSLIEPGPEAAVVSGVFTQLGNTFGLAGTADIAGTGLAADLIPSGPQSLETTAVIDLSNTQIASAAGTLTLRAAVLYTGRFFLDPEVTDTNNVDLTARSQFTGSSGFLVATAPASANQPDESGVATVTLTISPANPDVDDDGMADAWEREHGLDPADPGDALLDADGDGQPNRSEFLAGADPRLATSVLALSGLHVQDGSLVVLATGLTLTRSYLLEESESGVSWSPSGTPFTPAAESQEISRPLASDHRLFRLRCLTTWP
ncbi:MAG: Ig-like domain-containing protein [Verrucomicrobiales bacterium]